MSLIRGSGPPDPRVRPGGLAAIGQDFLVEPGTTVHLTAGPFLLAARGKIGEQAWLFDAKYNSAAIFPFLVGGAGVYLIAESVGSVAAGAGIPITLAPARLPSRPHPAPHTQGSEGR